METCVTYLRRSGHSDQAIGENKTSGSAAPPELVIAILGAFQTVQQNLSPSLASEVQALLMF